MTGNLFPLFLKNEKFQFNSGEWTEHVNNSYTRKSEFKLFLLNKLRINVTILLNHRYIIYIFLFDLILYVPSIIFQL